MSKKDDVEVLSEEEKALEQEGSNQLKEEEVRNAVIEDFGFDAEADKDKIDKLTGERMSSHKKLSTAIGQKVKIRGERDALKGKPADGKKDDDVVVPAAPVFSIKDTMALQKANVAEEDIDDVTEYAAFKKVSVAEALKSPILQATLKQKSEERQSAEATATGAKRTGNTRIPEAQLLENANKGVMPETSEDFGRLWNARHRTGKK